jgi:hypothetical protein
MAVGALNSQKAPDRLPVRGSLRSSLRCGAYVARDGASGRPLSVPPAVACVTSHRVGLKGAAGYANPDDASTYGAKRVAGA